MDNNTNYKYQFHLDTKTPTPELEKQADLTTAFSDSFRVYYFNLPAVSGAKVIQNLIEYVENNCQNYKLILIGEHQGHMEIFKSEDYDGELIVSLQTVTTVITPWGK
jgi:hypothetical protein